MGAARTRLAGITGYMVVALALSTGLAVAASLWADRYRESLRRPAKMVASTGFVLVAAAVGAFDSGYGRLVIAALALCWLGDLLLTYNRLFVPGLAAFLLGHVGFAVAFIVRGVDAGRMGLAVVPLVAVAAVAARWLWPHLSDRIRLPVVAYVVAITAMVLLAGGTDAFDPDWRIPLGAVLFFASDLLVARNRFVVPGWRNRLVGLPLYYGGQLLLAWSAG